MPAIPKPKKRKPQSLAKLKRKVWEQFSLYIRRRDDFTCFTCGKRDQSPQMHAGHFCRRGHANTLFDEMNVHAQCAGCNMYRDGEAHIYAQRLILKYGQKAFDDLVERSKQVKKFTREELNELYAKYKALNQL